MVATFMNSFEFEFVKSTNLQGKMVKLRERQPIELITNSNHIHYPNSSINPSIITLIHL